MKFALVLAAALVAAPAAMAQDHDHSAHAAATPAGAEGVGVIKSLDAKAGKVVIAHEPIPALNWPSMTMAFKADPKMLAGVKAGQKVRFTLQGQTITGFKPL